MEDTSLDSGGNDSGSQDDLSVDVDSLVIDGVRPKVGDQVDLKVGGTIRKLVDNTAFVTPDTINDQPVTPKPQASDDENMQAMATELNAGAMQYP